MLLVRIRNYCGPCAHCGTGRERDQRRTSFAERASVQNGYAASYGYLPLLRTVVQQVSMQHGSSAKALLIMTVTRILRIVAITDLQYVHDSIINYEYRIYENSIKPYYIEYKNRRIIISISVPTWYSCTTYKFIGIYSIYKNLTKILALLLAAS